MSLLHLKRVILYTYKPDSQSPNSIKMFVSHSFDLYQEQLHDNNED